MICRRWPEGRPKPPTQVVVLKRNPDTPAEVADVLAGIRERNLVEWGNVHEWPAERMVTGDWSAVQWFDGGLAEAAHGLDSASGLIPLGDRYQVGPAGQRIRDAFSKCEAGTPGAVPIFESKSGEVRQTLLDQPDGFRQPKPNKAKLAKRYLAQASRLLVSAGMNTQSGSLVCVFSNSPTVGNAWIPVRTPNIQEAKALAAWWNSTPAWLMLLNRRTTTLTFPEWSLKHLREIRVPKLDPDSIRTLSKAFEQVKYTPLLPWRNLGENNARETLDEAAASIMGVDASALADWRQRLAREPTVGGNP